jgi:hypothetical protein
MKTSPEVLCGSAALVERCARRLPRHAPPNRNGYATDGLRSAPRERKSFRC